MNAKKRLINAVVLCTVLLANLVGANSPARAASTVRYIAPSPAGSDAGDCSNPAAPCATLQYAVDQSSPGDELRLATGDYTGVQTVDGHAQIASLSKSLILKGGYNASFASRDLENTPTTLNAGALGRVLYIDGSGAAGLIDVTLDGLRMTGGYWGSSQYFAYNDQPAGYVTNSWWQAPAGGGVYSRKANLTVRDSRIYDNHTFNGTGSGLFQHYGSLTLQNSTVDLNSGTHDPYEPMLGDCGGGLFLLQVNATIANASILNNSAGYGDEEYHASTAYGGGIFANHSTLSIDHTLIQGNVAARHDSGRGGGIYVEWTATTLTNSSLIGNAAAQVSTYYGQQGGGAYLGSYGTGNTIVTNNLIQGNTIGGLVASGTVTVSGNTFKENSLPSNAIGGGGGVNLSGTGVFENNSLIGNSAVNGGGGLFGGSLTLTGNTFQGNTATTDGGGLVVDGTVTLVRNVIKENTAGNCGGGVLSKTLTLEDGDRLESNSAWYGGGLCIRANSGGAAYQNMVVIKNQASTNGSGIFIDRGSTSAAVNLRHLTIGQNTGGDGAGVTAKTGAVTFTNTILYSQAVGAQNIGGNLSFAHTLRNQVTTPVVGTVSDTFATSGDPAFAEDGYHLTQHSAAIDAGTATPVTDDVDGGARPLSQAPDLGADETPYQSDMPIGISASIQAGTPQWVLQWDLASSATTWQLQQDYLVQYSNGGGEDAPTLTSYAVQAALPGVLQLGVQETSPAMSLTQDGSHLTWNSTAPLAPGNSGWVGYVGQSKNVAPGTALNNLGTFDYSTNGTNSYSIPLQAASQAPDKPLLPPMLTMPMNGEMCLDEQGRLEGKGLTYAGMIVHIYENGNLTGTTTASASGEFSLQWTSALSDNNSVNVTATVCDPAKTNNCSAPSGAVHLDAPQAFWCPQRSYWEGTFGSLHYVFNFVNEQGHYATNDFVLPGVRGFAGTQLHLYSCCDRDTNPFKVIADDKTYENPVGHDGRMWTFNIGSAHVVTIQSQCQVGGKPSGGRILIDPDGYVFDSQLGGQYDTTSGIFTPVKPIPGITVTAYEYIPDWDTWIPWPAELYNGQVNPQVTGADGYFAFFTPPGKYYLQATGSDGYQSWRSPVINVVSQVVHANAPLTAWSENTVTQVLLDLEGGPSPASVTIPTGGTVEWVSTLGTTPTLEDLAALTKDPIQRILSTLDPLANAQGFDSGMQNLGGVYRRQFTRPGTYTYTDGLGNTGTIQVSGSGKVYLPMVKR